MIPEFYDGIYLPDGDHQATWPEVQEKFGVGQPRETHCRRLEAFLQAARNCGFVRVYLFGSFISGKPAPGDVDLLWVYQKGVEITQLRQECRDLLNYGLMKEREGWDMWCCSNDDFVINYLLEGWRADKSLRKIRRGIVIIELSSL